MESSKNNLGMEARVGSKYSLGAEEAVSESVLVLLLEESRSGSDICGAATEFSIVESGQPAYKVERGLRSSFLEERLAGT